MAILTIDRHQLPTYPAANMRTGLFGLAPDSCRTLSAASQTEARGIKGILRDRYGQYSHIVDISERFKCLSAWGDIYGLVLESGETDGDFIDRVMKQHIKRSAPRNWSA